MYSFQIVKIPKKIQLRDWEPVPHTVCEKNKLCQHL